MRSMSSPTWRQRGNVGRILMSCFVETIERMKYGQRAWHLFGFVQVVEENVELERELWYGFEMDFDHFNYVDNFSKQDCFASITTISIYDLVNQIA